MSGLLEQGVKGNAIPLGRVKRRQLLIWVQGRSIPVLRVEGATPPSKSDESRHFILVLPAEPKAKISTLINGSFAEKQVLKKEEAGRRKL